MQPNPVFVKIGPIAIYWYGVLIVTGAMLAAQIASYVSSRNGHDPEIAWNMLIVLLLCGIVGARLYHVASAWDYYRQYPQRIFCLQMRGFGIFGGVAGGAIGLWVYCKVKKLRFLEWGDYIAPGLLLAQAIGRLGNFFNQELYGYPTDLPWGVYIAPENRLAEFASYEYFHPTFFYESLLNLLGFTLLFTLALRWRKNRLYGDLFYLYLVIYPFVRFFIEFQRPDAWMMPNWMPLGLPMAQWVSILMFVVFGALFFVRRKLQRPSMVYVPGTPWSAKQASIEEATSEDSSATMDASQAAAEGEESED